LSETILPLRVVMNGILLIYIISVANVTFPCSSPCVSF